ncbi:MAG TPA: T9SS type A sorting domain-containing protein [Candidatus Kryptonia bacterium]
MRFLYRNTFWVAVILFVTSIDALAFASNTSSNAQGRSDVNSLGRKAVASANHSGHKTHPGRVSVLKSRPHVPLDLSSEFNFTATNGTFNTISSTGTEYDGGSFDHDEGTEIGIPIGFTFYFGGNPYSTVNAASNGWLSFNPSSLGDGGFYFTGTLSGADASMLPFLAPLDADLYINGSIFYETDGSAPNRTFTVEWDHVVGYGNSDSATASDQLSFQVIMYEATGEIQFVYTPGPDYAVAFNTEDSPSTLGIVDSLGNYIAVSDMSTSATVSSSGENDAISPPPSEGLTFSFTPLVYDYSLAVQATDFIATPDIGSVTLSWKTQSEIKNAGFNILREDPGMSSFKMIASYSNTENLKGLGTSTSGRVYSFTDDKVTSGSTYSYRIQSVSTSGAVKDLNTLTAIVDVPQSYALYQNYPNPFNPATTIRFDLKEASTVTLEIYNVLGQRVMEQEYGTMNAGRYNESISMGRFSSGVYYYRISAVGNDGQKFTSVKKLVMMK